jgi:hypothetical protein
MGGFSTIGFGQAQLTFKDLLNYDLIQLGGYTGSDPTVRRTALGSASDVVIETYGCISRGGRFVRYKDFNNHYYHGQDVGTNSQDHWFLKRVAGSWTVLGSEAVNLYYWTAYRYKLEVSGSTFKCYRDDMTTPKFTVVDTTFSFGLYGLVSHYGGDTNKHPCTKFYEVKVNGVDYNEPLTLDKIWLWGLFPSKISYGVVSVNTILLPPATDGWIQAKVESHQAGLSMRFKDHANHYWIDTQEPGNAQDFRLGKSVNGVETVLGVEAVDINKYTLYTLKLEVYGSTLKAYRDDMTTPKITATDTSITGSGYRAIFNWSGYGEEFFQEVIYG